MNTHREISRTCSFRAVLLCVALMLCAPLVRAQEFSVASFRSLPNDVSAFIEPVRDLNDEACALIKVEAPEEFAFSSPLGIVKRRDEVGEIWLYLPKGTRTLTLKHPEWGILRDYRLGKPLESRMTYEMKLNLPKVTPIIQELHDTIVEVKTIVDTIAVVKKRAPMPLSAHILVTSALHTDGPSWGLMFALLRRHGAWLHLSSNLQTTGGTVGNCDKQGNLIGTTDKPYYTGDTRHSNYTVTAGAIHHLTHGLCLFEGLGYGRAATAWQQTESSGGGYLLNEGLTHKGVAAELGLLASFGRVDVAASAITIAGKQWQCSIGVGIKLGR